jgi:hypothetical protein
LQLWLEQRIAGLHPDPAVGSDLAHSAELVHLALMLNQELPMRPLAEMPRDGVAGNFLMVGDYLLSCAMERMSRLGIDALATIGRATANLASFSETDAVVRGTNGGDSRGEVAALLARLVVRARGASLEDVESIAEKCRRTSVSLYRLDRSRLGSLVALFGGSRWIGAALHLAESSEAAGSTESAGPA